MCVDLAYLLVVHVGSGTGFGWIASPNNQKNPKVSKRIQCGPVSLLLCRGHVPAPAGALSQSTIQNRVKLKYRTPKANGRTYRAPTEDSYGETELVGAIRLRWHLKR